MTRIVDRVVPAFRLASRHVIRVEAPGFSLANCGQGEFGFSLGRAVASYQGTTSVVPKRSPFLFSRAGFSPRHICVGGLA